MTIAYTSLSTLTLSYEGPVLSEHSMSVRDLGPALIAIGELFDRASHLVYRDEATIDLRISATRPGSFEIELAVELARQATTMLSGPIITSALNLRQIVMASITWLKSSRRGHETLVARSEQQDVETMESLDIRVGDMELTSLASPDTNRLALQTVARLSSDRLIRESFRRVFEPLNQNGIDRVEIKENGNTLESVEEHDLLSFDPFEGEMNIVDSIIPRQMLKVVNPYLGQGTGQWRLHDGNRTNRYGMMDLSFLRDVRSGVIVFRSEDVLECRVRHIQSIDSNGNIRTDREVLRVLKHHSRNNGDLQLRITDM